MHASTGYMLTYPPLVTFIYYDQPEFDVFWQMVVDLDVPVYFHPRVNPDPVATLLFAQAPFLIGPAQEFAVTLSNHLLGMCTNGVFEYVGSPNTCTQLSN